MGRITRQGLAPPTHPCATLRRGLPVRGARLPAILDAYQNIAAPRYASYALRIPRNFNRIVDGLAELTPIDALICATANTLFGCMNMKTTIIVLNILAAILVFPAMSLVHQAQLASARSMYVELDRAQVIDRQKLAEMFPDELKNDRYDIPKRFVAWRRNAWMVGYPCVAGFGLNALLIGIFLKRKPRAEPSLSPYVVNDKTGAEQKR